MSEPGTISFSGGRTSAYMLRGMLDRGLVGTDTHVLFANTGRERQETLRFVRDVGVAFGVKIHWIEWAADAKFREVNFEDASRNGEPFEALIAKRKFLPNPVTRFCTQELKIRPMREWMKARGYRHWTNFVGIRRDEPRRYARLINPERKRKERFEMAFPLWDWGATLATVEEFWSRQSFKLELQPHEGNCDLCFLKTAAKRVQIANERPDLAAWWHEQERRLGSSFRKEGTLAQHQAIAHKLKLADEAQGDLFTCFCGDAA